MTDTLLGEDGRVIGIDFDNTIVSYAGLLRAIALERGLLSDATAGTKRQIRDRVRLLPDGEIEWQKLQAVVYGPRINEATLIDGVRSFFKACTTAGVKTFVISHKTEFAGYDETRTDLRQSAIDWMEAHDFFESAGLGLSPRSVFFGATRHEKIEFIKRLGCTHFIDDLEETFLEPSFPTEVEKILYAPDALIPATPGMRVAASWQDIHEIFFGTNRRSGV